MEQFFENMIREIEEKKRPYSDGVFCAYRAWDNTRTYKAEVFEATELPWGEAIVRGEMAMFVETIKEAGITEFAVTDRSTSLMEEIHALIDAGCTLSGPVTVKRHPEYWGDEEHKGLLFSIK